MGLIDDDQLEKIARNGNQIHFGILDEAVASLNGKTATMLHTLPSPYLFSISAAMAMTLDAL